jgi:hypothetical protein
MTRNYGKSGLHIGLVLAALVAIGGYTMIFGAIIAADDTTAHGPTHNMDESDDDPTMIERLGMLLYFVGLIHVIVLPVSMYFDTTYLGDHEDWSPLRPFWVPMALIPVVQIPATVLYLLWRSWQFSVKPALVDRSHDSRHEALTSTDSPTSKLGETIPRPSSESEPTAFGRIISYLGLCFDVVFSFVVSYLFTSFLLLGSSRVFDAVTMPQTPPVIEIIGFITIFAIWMWSFRRIWKWKRSRR